MSDIKFEWYLTSPDYEFRARCEATLKGRCFELTVDEQQYKENKASVEQTLKDMFTHAFGIKG